MLPDLSDIRKISTMGCIPCTLGPGGERVRGDLTWGVRACLSHLNETVVVLGDVAPLQRFPRRLVALEEQFVQMFWTREHFGTVHAGVHHRQTDRCTHTHTHLVIFHALDGQMVAVDPQRVPEDAHAVLLLLLKHLEVNRTALLHVHTADEWVTLFREVQNVTMVRISSRHHAICSGLPRTCWCALTPIPGEWRPAAPRWISTASLEANPGELWLTFYFSQYWLLHHPHRHLPSSLRRGSKYTHHPQDYFKETKEASNLYFCPYLPPLQLLDTVWICCSSNGEEKKCISFISVIRFGTYLFYFFQHSLCIR